MGDTDGRSSRLLRGVLDACLLAIVEAEDRYGYELTSALHAAGLDTVSDGSIYPLLTRLEKRGLLSSYRRPAASGPPRRYYQITPKGRSELATAVSIWQQVATGVDAVLGRHRDEGK